MSEGGAELLTVGQAAREQWPAALSIAHCAFVARSVSSMLSSCRSFALLLVLASLLLASTAVSAGTARCSTYGADCQACAAAPDPLNCGVSRPRNGGGARTPDADRQPSDRCMGAQLASSTVSEWPGLTVRRASVAGAVALCVCSVVR